MFNITGRLADGKSFRAQIPSEDAGAAVNQVVKNLPAGASIAMLIVKPAPTGAFIKFAKPRAAKKDNGAAPAAVAAANTRRR